MFKFYDDELHNLILIADKNLREIVEYTSHYDYHPPLQYIINKISLQVFGLNEFWLSLPSIVFILLSIIICNRLVYQLAGSMKLSLLTGFLTAINPLILLWGASIRWYPLWTFLIILAIYLFIKLWNDKREKITINILLIITLTLALYTNYQTISFLVAAVLTSLALDIKNIIFINLKRTIIVFLGIFILFIPYLYVFMFHLQNFFLRKEIYLAFSGTSSLVAGGYFLFSIFFGNSIYPWQPIFIVLFTIGFIALIISLIAVFEKRKIINTEGAKSELVIRKDSIVKINDRLLKEIIYFAISITGVFLIQSIISSTLTNRGVIFLPMLLIAACGSFIYYLYKTYPIKTKMKLLHYSLTLSLSSLILLWFIGSYNVFTRQHLHKSGLAIPVKEIIAAIDKLENDYGENISVITTDPVLTFYLLKINRTKMLSPYAEDLPKLFNKKIIKQINEYDKLIFIQSTPGALLPVKNKLSDYTNYLFKSSNLISKPTKFKYDPDYAMKRKFFASAGIERWKYSLNILSPLNKWDINILEKIKGFRVY